MCGLAGFLDLRRATSLEALREIAGRMADTLIRRGPDDRGVWADPDAGVALGFRRLSIVDLSPEGHQPMTSASGRYVLVFNGEIYNFGELRHELEATGATFRGHSDTEVMLAAIERWGLESAVGRFVGMYAFALWDRHDRRLHLGRDRLGEKPMYYGRVGSAFLFGSELKALKAHPEFRGVVDRGALALYLRHGYVPAPYSIYEAVRKLPPGSILSLGQADDGAPPLPRPYWTARRAAEVGQSEPFEGTDEEAADGLERLLRDAVRRQMVADVPLGAFLSGGIDSSTVVSLMQAQSTRPVRTFTIGFREDGFDEAVHAKAVAKHLGTDHTEMYVTPAEALGVVPDLPVLFDEPFGDSSGVPTFLVSRLARSSVTVSLSGDGGDELFCGYPWYPRVARVWKQLRSVPRPLRHAAAGALGRPLDAVRPALPATLKRRASGERAGKLARLLQTADGPERVHRLFGSAWDDPSGLVPGAAEPASAMTDPSAWADLEEVEARLMYLDTVTYLPDDILTKVDRASMGVSLESRAPMLDHRVVEFALRLPLTMKRREGRSKWVLRKVLHRHVPRELVERPKMGFSVPVGDWLRGPLRDWAGSLLDAGRLAREGFLDPATVARAWDEHQRGDRNREHPLWNVLMFQGWLESQSTGGC